MLWPFGSLKKLNLQTLKLTLFFFLTKPVRWSFPITGMALADKRTCLARWEAHCDFHQDYEYSCRPQLRRDQHRLEQTFFDSVWEVSSETPEWQRRCFFGGQVRCPTGKRDPPDERHRNRRQDDCRGIGYSLHPCLNTWRKQVNEETVN